MIWTTRSLRIAPTTRRHHVTELQRRIYDHLVLEGSATRPELAQHLGVPRDKLDSAILSLSQRYPVYEYQREDGQIVYGMTDRRTV